MMLSGWKDRRDRKRAESEAKHLASEARRILQKKNYRIPEAVTMEIEAAVAEVEQALAGPDLDRTRQALNRLDDKMNEHLAFARKSSVREYGESIGVAVAIALLLRAFVVEAFQIPSGSMIPTLEIGDHIFVSKFSYGLSIPFTNKKILQLSTPKRGDVIVFKYPLDPEIDYIKRVVALPGERVSVKNNEVFIDGRPMPRELLKIPCSYQEGPQVEGQPNEKKCERWLENLDGKVHPTNVDPDHPSPTANYAGLVVPPGRVFVMGDNRDNSNDSRGWGTVPEELIKGRALIVWWSRGPTSGEFSLSGIKEWFAAIRWRRFLSLVK
jgi:signal peptidase I